MGKFAMYQFESYQGVISRQGVTGTGDTNYRYLRAKFKCLLNYPYGLFRSKERAAYPGAFFPFIKTTPAKPALYIASRAYRQVNSSELIMRLPIKAGVFLYQVTEFFIRPGLKAISHFFTSKEID